MATVEVMASCLIWRRRLILLDWMNQHNKKSAELSAGVLIIRTGTVLMKVVRTLSHEAEGSHQFLLNLFSGTFIQWSGFLVNMCQN